MNTRAGRSRLGDRRGPRALSVLKTSSSAHNLRSSLAAQQQHRSTFDAAGPAGRQYVAISSRALPGRTPGRARYGGIGQGGGGPRGGPGSSKFKHVGARPALHKQALSELLRAWCSQQDQQQHKEEGVSDPEFLHNLAFQSVVLPRHLGKLPLVYRAYSVLLNERLGAFDHHRVRELMEQPMGMVGVSRQGFRDECLDMPEVQSFLDEFWRIVCDGGMTSTSIGLGDLLPDIVPFSVYRYFHDALARAFPFMHGKDTATVQSDWLKDAAQSEPIGWAGTTDTEVAAGGETITAETNLGLGEWHRSQFERQLLTLVTEIFCEGMQSPMRVLKCLRELFERLFPHRRVEIKRLKKKKNLTSQHSERGSRCQRSFGEENFIVASVPTSLSSSHRSSNSFSQLNLAVRGGGPVGGGRGGVELPGGRKLGGENQRNNSAQSGDDNGDTKRRGSGGASRRQSMFGAFLFDFVLRRSQNTIPRPKATITRRPHLSSLTACEIDDVSVSSSPRTSGPPSPTTTEQNDATLPTDDQLSESMPAWSSTIRPRATSTPEEASSSSTKSASSLGLSTEKQSSPLSPTSRRLPRRNSMLNVHELSTLKNSSKVDLIAELKHTYDPTGKGASEGQSDLYSTKALLQRESLKFDKKVMHELKRIWNLVDVDKNRVIDYSEFAVMHHKLFVLYHSHLPENERPSQEEEMKMLREDWAKDSAPLANDEASQREGEKRARALSRDLNEGLMTREHFVRAWFHMADLWTDGISAELYTDFLRFTITKIAKIGEDGKLRWMDDREIVALEQHAVTSEETAGVAADDDREVAGTAQENAPDDSAAVEDAANDGTEHQTSKDAIEHQRELATAAANLAEKLRKDRHSERPRRHLQIKVAVGREESTFERPSEDDYDIDRWQAADVQFDNSTGADPNFQGIVLSSPEAHKGGQFVYQGDDRVRRRGFEFSTQGGALWDGNKAIPNVSPRKINANSEWLGRKMPRKGPSGAVGEKPRSVVSRLHHHQAAYSLYTGEKGGRRRGQQDSIKTVTHITKPRLVYNDRTKRMQEMRAARRDAENQGRVHMKVAALRRSETLDAGMDVAFDESPHASRPHRLLGNVPGVKSPQLLHTLWSTTQSADVLKQQQEDAELARETPNASLNGWKISGTGGHKLEHAREELNHLLEVRTRQEEEAFGLFAFAERGVAMRRTSGRLRPVHDKSRGGREFKSSRLQKMKRRPQTAKSRRTPPLSSLRIKLRETLKAGNASGTRMQTRQRQAGRKVLPRPASAATHRRSSSTRETSKRRVDERPQAAFAMSRARSARPMSASAGRDRKALKLAEKFLPAEYKETVIGVDKLFELMRSSPGEPRRKKTRTRTSSGSLKAAVMTGGQRYDEDGGRMGEINAPYRVRVPRKLILGARRAEEGGLRATV